MPLPDCCVMVTTAPPPVRALPLASLAVTVSTWLAAPLAVMLALVGVRVDWVALAVPGVTVRLPETALVRPLAAKVRV